MDGCSWLLLHGGHGDVTDSSDQSYVSAGAGGLHEEQDVAISLEVRQQLKQICMLMDIEEQGYAEAVPTPSSSTFASFVFSNPDENSSLTVTESTMTTTTSCHQPLEISSLQMPLSPIAYDDGDHGLFYGNLDTIVNLDDLMAQEPHQEQAQGKNGHEFGGAFMPYIRHLSPRKKPKRGACGQRAIKNAMSALARMHSAKLAQWQSLQMEMTAPPSVGSSSVNQIQHVLSERKRREKLNDSFKALRTVLPPGSERDRASTLIRARDYVNTLKDRVSELEEKHRMLVEPQLHGDNSIERDVYSGEQIVVDITDKAPAEETSQEFCLQTVLSSERSARDVIVTVLQSLKEFGDVRLVATDSGSSSSGGSLPPGKNIQIATVTLQVMSSRCDHTLLKESVIKTFKDAMKSETILTT